MTFDEPKDEATPFLPLIMKAKEYYACARHLNLRGVAGVLVEVKTLIESHKAAGRTFDEFIEACTQLAGGEAPPTDDPFIKNVREFWAGA
jgi:hypothetical protein